MIDLEIGSVVTIKSIYHDTLTKECLEIKENKREDRAQLYANRILKNCKILDKKGERTKIDFGLGEWWIKNKAWTDDLDEKKKCKCTVEGDLHYLKDFPYFPNRPPEEETRRTQNYTHVACMAMSLKFLKLGGIESFEDYELVARDFCNGRHHYYNKRICEKLGVFVHHSCSLGQDDIEERIDQGFPVPCALVARGRWEDPHGLASYVVIYGYDDEDWLVMDPMGEFNVERGLWNSKEDGSGKELRLNKEKLDKRLFHGGGYGAWGYIDFREL